MTSGDTFEIEVSSHNHDALSTRAIGSENNRRLLHKMMLQHHEDVFENSDDEVDKSRSKDQDDQDDEGGIPAWNSMRRSVNANKATSNDQKSSGPPSPCVTAAISLHDGPSVRDDHNCKDKYPLTTVEVAECNSESSTDREEVTPTDSEFQPSSYQENVAPSITSYSAPTGVCGSSNISRRGSDDYVEYFSGGCKVMQGGFKRIKEIPQPKALSEPFRTYPPLSNSGYILTSTAHDPKFELKEELANPTFVARSCIKALKDSLLKPKPTSTTQPQSLVPPLPTKEPGSEEHWVDPYDVPSDCGSSANSKQQYSPDTTNMLCGKCGIHHIPSGWLCSLGERDLCGSYLPDWFPAERCENPWLTFTDFFNDIYRLESLERGHTLRFPKWNKVYHTEHPVWKTLGLTRGGWWRCRSGPNAPRAEKDCYNCHDENPLGEARYAHNKYTNHETMEIAMETLNELRNFVDVHMHRVGQKDKAIALDMIRESITPKACTSQISLHSVGIGRASNGQKAHEIEEGKIPRNEERLILEAIWIHRGPMSTLDIPIRSAFSFEDFPDHDLDNDHRDDDDTGMMMMSTIRRHSRPPPLSFHRQTSSFGSNFFSALLSHKAPSMISPSTISPSMPPTPEIPEEGVQASED
ncbi:uncharacterized protein RSE6_03682 [Rhynchosporium secalis]|uniref:Uncharacterized protein n=1 Tax=Rhynchosporium secalis TaxID=38038 RepID=A0A1E1M3E9_RHYSE|nr:uncharacterized protein RSE6_03682 [Rhynchosporium secalis]